MPPRSKTLVIGLDAADVDLVFRWSSEGKLPTLGGLIERGAAVRLSSDTGLGSEAVWPTALTGCMPGKHGNYNWRCVKPGTNQLVRTPSRSFRKPFWWVLRNRDPKRRVLLLDVPYVSRLEDDGVTEVLGWGQREAARHHSWPDGLLEELTAEYGSYPRGLEDEGPDEKYPPEEVLDLLRHLADLRTRLLSRLMRERAWDLCLAFYFEPHHGGHRFHRYVEPGELDLDEGLTRRFEGALLEVYRACDDAIERLVEVAGDDVNVLVVSGCGMCPATHRANLLSKALSRLGYRVPASPSARSRAIGAGRSIALRAIPRPLARWIKARLPERVEADHFERLWIESTDWDRTRAYDEDDSWHPFVRLNVADSERAALAEEIATEIRALRNAETGEPAAGLVLLRDEIAEGPNASLLPDLAVHWSTSRFLHRARHPRAGVIEGDPIGPWSEHNRHGFLIAAGPGIRPRGEPFDDHLVNLAPTLLHLLGAPVPEDMDGAPMEGLLAGDLGAPTRAQIDLRDDPWDGT
jgi:predicted AlkP superfamily phosphohydrolase/phosphomutase